jgi:long-chain acyl-CoA synthetase
LLTLDALARTALDLRGQTAIDAIIITSLEEYALTATPAPNIEGTLRLADLLAGVGQAGGADLPHVEIDPAEDVAALQYTGGTTGVPKGAMLTHYNIFANVVQAESWLFRSIRRGEETFLLVIPYFHAYGFTIALLAGTWMGARQIIMPKYDVEALLVAIRDFRPTYFPGVPTLYISLLNHPAAKAHGIDRIRIFGCGSAPCPVAVIEQFERLTGGTLTEGYGLSEASAVTHSTAMLARHKPGSIGLAFPDTDMKIVDLETGTREMPVGGEGELCIAGPQVMKGYWRQPAASADALRPDAQGRHWLYTGDVARMDDDGYTYLVQRKKDLIIVSGFNVYPAEVEGVLLAHPAVSEAAVVGTPDAYRGEAVKAYVVLRRGAVASAGELIAHCAVGLADYKVPHLIEFRASLPRSAVGKILHRVLREEAARNAAEIGALD